MLSPFFCSDNDQLYQFEFQAQLGRFVNGEIENKFIKKKIMFKI